jgi:hypothetical protein
MSLDGLSECPFVRLQFEGQIDLAQTLRPDIFDPVMLKPDFNNKKRLRDESKALDL